MCAKHFLYIVWQALSFFIKYLCCSEIISNSRAMSFGFVFTVFFSLKFFFALLLVCPKPLFAARVFCAYILAFFLELHIDTWLNSPEKAIVLVEPLIY